MTPNDNSTVVPLSWRLAFWLWTALVVAVTLLFAKPKRQPLPPATVYYGTEMVQNYYATDNTDFNKQPVVLQEEPPPPAHKRVRGKRP